MKVHHHCINVKYQKLEVKTNTFLNKGNRNLSAVKADDVEVPEYIWDEALMSEGELDKKRVLNHLRLFVLRWWKSNIRQEFLEWGFGEHPFLKKALHQCTTEGPSWHERLRKSRESFLDWTVGQDCIAQCCNSTRWEWCDGSRPHFWLWLMEHWMGSHLGSNQHFQNGEFPKG